MGLLIGVGDSRPQSAYDYWYGIEWDVTVSNPHPTRIGKKELHKELPLQNMMRGCLLKDDGSVNYYLHANDSTKRDNGANANLSGADGQVMVELPDVYIRFERDGNKCRALMSPQELPGFILLKKDYISMFEASVQRSANKLCSVVNATADYRGGNNTTAYDGKSNTLIGRPATNISLNTFRTYARNRGAKAWNCNTYSVHRKLWWLFAIEYCTFNSQEAYNAALTTEGYHQGGLGDGVTTLDWGKWSTFNGNNPFVPCGFTNSLGNHSGYIEYTMPAEYDATTKKVQVNRYRGVELPFGHVWKWTDGCKCMIQSDTDGGLSKFYVADDVNAFKEGGVDGYDYRGNLPRKEGYVKEILLGENGEMMPLSVGGGSTTYFCDYFYTNIPTSGTAERGVLFGGLANAGANAGFVCAYTAATASNANAYVGSRLCYIPQG